MCSFSSSSLYGKSSFHITQGELGQASLLLKVSVPRRGWFPEGGFDSTSALLDREGIFFPACTSFLGFEVAPISPVLSSPVVGKS